MTTTPGSTPPASTPQETERGTGHPLGPLIWREPLERPVLGRLVALVIFAACASGIGLAAWLDPDAHGYGSHRTLGIGPCGFLLRTGFPCPTCGMTTSCALAVRGRLGEAFYAQPLGPFVILGGIVCGLASLTVALTARTWVINWYRISPLKVLWILGIVFILAWAIKIAVGLIDGSLPARSV
jgi:hypothetical protein